MKRGARTSAQVALVGFFCISGCTTPAPVEKSAAPSKTGAVVSEAAPTGTSAVNALITPEASRMSSSAAPPSIPATLSDSASVQPSRDPVVLVPERDSVVTLQPVSEPRYALPESLKQFRFPQKNQTGVVLAKNISKRESSVTKPGTANPKPTELEPAIDIQTSVVTTVNAQGEAPRYKLPESLSEWRSGRKVPLYEDPDAAPWQASPTEPRLQNAAVSCNYKDEGGVRGKIMLLVDDFKVTRFNARIDMPNGGVCQFDAKKMTQRPFEQGIALESKGDECVVRMWEQKHRITIAAYSCHKQCSKGSFSYLWPILMDTRIGTCY